MVTTIEKILGSTKGTSPITPSDRALFENYKKNCRGSDDLDFKDSWAYVAQASRNFPYKLLNGDGLYFLGARKNFSAVVIPNYFAKNPASVANAASSLASKNLDVILKNISLEEVPSLCDQGFRRYNETERWDRESKYDDQTFPQRIVTIDSLLKLEGEGLAHIRRKLRRFREQHSDVTVRDYSSGRDFLKVRRLLEMQEKKLSGFTEAHQPLIRMESYGSLVRRVFEIDGEVEGLFIGDAISDTCFAYNAIIHNPEIQHFSTYLALKMAKQLKKSGYTHFNFQGSETQNGDQWKKTFNPRQSIEKTHLILDKI